MAYFSVRHSHPLKKLFWAFGFFGLLLVFGTIGFMLVEGYSFLDALYMTVISVSSVGYGIEGDGHFTDNGKIFTIVLLFFGAGAFIFVITTLTSFVIEGQLRDLINRYRFKLRVKNLDNHIIICGLGRTGKECAAELARQNRPFIGIDARKEIMDDMALHYPRLFSGIVGDATLEEVLEQAHIGKAKGLISALPNDAENVFIALTARGMNEEIEIISRAEHDYNIPKILKAGANHVILPNLMGGRRMVNLLTRPGLVEFIELITGENESETQLHIESIDCEKYPKLWGKTLAELHIRSQTELLVVGRKQAGKATELNPSPQMIVNATDKLFIIGSLDKFPKLNQFLVAEEG